MDIIDQYIKEIENDLNIDDFNIKESAMKTPTKKHFWVSRLIQHKKNIIKLREQKQQLKIFVTKQIIEQSPVKITSPIAEKTALQHEEIRELDKKIAEEELVIEFLEKTEKTFSGLSFDIKNIVEIMKLEQL